MDVANVADNDWYAVRVEGGDAKNSDSVVDDVAAVGVVAEEAAAAAEEGVEAGGLGAGVGAGVENGSAPVGVAAAEAGDWDGWGEKGVAEAAVADGAVLMRQIRFQGQSVQAVGLVRSSHVVEVAAAAAESGFVVPHVAVEVAVAVVVVGVEEVELVYSEFPD